MRNHLLYLITFLLICSCDNPQPVEEQYSGLFNATTDKANLVLPDLISTGSNERDFTISPKQKEIFFTLASPKNRLSAICQIAKNKNANWENVQIASFSGKYSDLEPFISPNGNTLFFASNRPDTGEGNLPQDDYDLWFTSKSDSGWSQPTRLPDPINTFGNEFYPAVARSNNLYFTAELDSGFGREDIYVAYWNGNGYEKPVPLPESINSEAFEFNAYVNPDETLIIFSSFGRGAGQGGGDLYYSTKKNGQWQKAKLLPSPINSEYLDYCPYYFEEEQVLIFSSDRHNFNSTQFNNIDSLRSSFSKPGNGFGDIYQVKIDLN